MSKLLTNDSTTLSGKIRDWLFTSPDDGVLRWTGVADWLFILRKGFADKIPHETNMSCISLLEIEFPDIFSLCGLDDWALWVGVGATEHIELGGACCCGGPCCCVGGPCCCGVGTSCCCCGGGSGVCGGEICGARGSGGGGGGKSESESAPKSPSCITGATW